MQIPLIGPKPNPAVPWADCNLYVSSQVVAGHSKPCLIGMPGLKKFASVGQIMEVRGGILCGNTCYFVCGNTLYSLSSGGVFSVVGTPATIVTASGIVQMASNGLQVMIIDGVKGYILTLAAQTLVEITDADFLGAATLTYQDGYFIVNVPSTNKFLISASYDGTSWSATDYALKEGWPDNINAVFSDHRELLLLGEEESEAWQNTGALNFPFQRMGGGTLQQGIRSPLSIAQIDETPIWFNNFHQFVRAVNYVPGAISSEHLSLQIGNLTTKTDGFAFTYSMSGHSFYQVTFIADNVTYLYDLTTGLWFRRQSGISGRHRANCYVYAWGKHLIGDYANGNIYEMSPSYFDEDGSEIQRIHTFPEVVSPDRINPMPHNRFSLHMKYGVGLDAAAEPGSTPVMALKWSKDGEMTWTTEKTASIGQIGEYGIRASWRRLGQDVRRSYRITTTDPVEIVISEANLD